MAEAQCPYCLEQIQENALVCKHCKNVLKDKDREPPEPPKKKDPPGPLWKNPTWIGAITALVAVLVAGATPVCNVVVQTFFVEREKLAQAKEAAAAKQRADYLKMASGISEKNIEAKLPILRFLELQERDEKLQKWAAKEIITLKKMRNKLRNTRKFYRPIIRAYEKFLELLSERTEKAVLQKQIVAIRTAETKNEPKIESAKKKIENQIKEDSPATAAKTKATIQKWDQRIEALSARAGTLFTAVQKSSLPTSVSGLSCAACTDKVDHEHQCPENFKMTSCGPAPTKTHDCGVGLTLVKVTCTRRKPAAKKPAPAKPMTPKPTR